MTPSPTAPGHFTAPRYGSGSVADLLPSVLCALGAGGTDPLGLADRLAGVRRVAVLLVDGLGHHLLPIAAPVAPVLAGASRLPGLTAGFPSTTPTSLVSVGTGAPPGAHGVVGFTVRLPGTERTFTHIRWDADVDPRVWQPLDTQFDRAAAAGIHPYVVGGPQFADSGLTVAAYRGAAYRPATGVPGTAAAVLAALSAADRTLVYGYVSEVDRAAHLAGPGSPPWLAAVAEADTLVAGIAAGLPSDAALLVTADHGAVRVDDADRIDVDAAPELLAGTTVITGEPRVRYVHTAPGALADVLAAWREALAGRALVVTRDEAIQSGWYGPTTPAAAARIGDVVALGTDRYVLTRSVAEPYESTFLGYHGSLTEAEMAVPLLLVRPGEAERR
ncbi:MAG TPA: nucleotide pyrophosphatase/phosphodiesterase family protein [Actinocatenispora sp.]